MKSNEEKRKESFFAGHNAVYIYQIYKRYLSNPFSVETKWREIFEDIGDDLAVLEADYERLNNDNAIVGSRIKTPLADLQFADDEKSAPNNNNNNYQAVLASNTSDVGGSTLDSVRALMLIRAYRVRGNLLANLDPLQLNPTPYHQELDPKYYGFEENDWDRPIFLNYVLGMESGTLRQVMTLLRKTYCGKIGVEFMHVEEPEKKSWVQARIESSRNEKKFTKHGRLTIMKRLAEAELFENFLGKKHIGVKRFGLDGGESLVPLFEQIMKVGGSMGIKEVIVGMAHRGRLNALANIMRKPYRAIFSEFRGKSYLPTGMEVSGDVKYHLGASADRDFDGNKIHISLTANPSHLEAVNTVVLGKVRAKQQILNDSERKKILGILIHGDASMAGQGIVAETFLMSNLYGYRTGGTIHIVINNQIGFTTSPKHSRSSTYCTDIAKVVGAPIFHVNGDDPEACIHIARLATEYRQTFQSDVVIDMVCYRRHGHNEADEPMFTQPSMYTAIAKHPTVFATYRDRLLKEGVITQQDADDIVANCTKQLNDEMTASETYSPNKADWLEGEWKGFHAPSDDVRRGITAVSKDGLLLVANNVNKFPEGFNVHPKIIKHYSTRCDAFVSGKPIDWSFAEALAMGTLLVNGTPVRFSGEDSKRGTFSHRHAVVTDQKTDDSYVPLNNITHNQASLEIIDSPLSEFGVLGFEYGFALAEPHSLVVWEAQFGDFANGAQVIFDQFIASGEVKWLRMCGLVVLLPHGYEGQGPEHSSARLERFLQLSAEDNWQVCNISTPANYFHALRRQIMRNFRKPLIIMSPKSLLRHKLCTSVIDDFTGDSSFHRVLPDSMDKTITDSKIKRVIFCSGKVYYDLLQKREETKNKEIYLARIEQLYPYPNSVIIEIINRFPKAEVVWCQEEPKNMGAWQYIDRLLEGSISASKNKSGRPKYIGRPESASTASGIAATHIKEQETFINQALKIGK